MAKASAEDHARGREIAEHELVALLGDGGRRRYVDDERNAFLLGHLGNRRALAGVEGTDQELRAVIDQFFRSRAGHLDVGLGVRIHDGEFRKTAALEDRRCNLHSAIAILADTGLGARSGQ